MDEAASNKAFYARPFTLNENLKKRFLEISHFLKQNILRGILATKQTFLTLD